MTFDRRRKSARAWILVTCLPIAACRAPERPPTHVLEGLTMGTTYRVTVRTEIAPAALARLAARVEERLAGVDDRMSTYVPESELRALSRHAAGVPFVASPALLEVLALGQEVFERSGGAFDPTVAPLVDAWGFGPGDVPARRPEPTAVSELRARVGLELLTVDGGAGTVVKAVPGVSLDLSGIAKGWAAELVAAELVSLGHTDALVDVGGELRAVGEREGGGGWRVALEGPRDPIPERIGVVELTDEGVATSGDYRNFFEQDGVRYAHILDPRTGSPVPFRGFSVSVVHGNAATADAWATALTVLGPAEGLELATREGLAALFAHRTSGGLEVRATPTLAARLRTP